MHCRHQNISMISYSWSIANFDTTLGLHLQFVVHEYNPVRLLAMLCYPVLHPQTRPFPAQKLAQIAEERNVDTWIDESFPCVPNPPPEVENERVTSCRCITFRLIISVSYQMQWNSRYDSRYQICRGKLATNDTRELVSSRSRTPTLRCLCYVIMFWLDSRQSKDSCVASVFGLGFLLIRSWAASVFGLGYLTHSFSSFNRPP